METLTQKLHDHITREAVSESCDGGSGHPTKEQLIAETEQLAGRLSDHALRVALSKIRRYEDAEEVAQNTVIKALGSLNQFRGDCNIFTWSNVIARNEIALFYRKQKPSPQPLSYNLEDRRPLDQIEGVDLNILFQQVLPERECQASILRWIHDMSYKGIAERLDIPLNTVRTLLRKAKLKLREVYRSEGISSRP